MSETVNVGEIAEKLSEDIFSFFFWQSKDKWNENFECHCPTHLGTDNKPKTKHPGDVVFHYEDPYLGSTTYLHTDLKSYKKKSITKTSMRDALKSLALTIECARDSESWRETYGADTSESFEVKGLLFVHNHDRGYEGAFDEVIAKIGFESLPIPPDVYMHYLGPKDIQRLYTIANDIIRLMHQKKCRKSIPFTIPIWL